MLSDCIKEPVVPVKLRSDIAVKSLKAWPERIEGFQAEFETSPCVAFVPVICSLVLEEL